MECDEDHHRLDESAEDHPAQKIEHHGPGILTDKAGRGLGHEDRVAQREAECEEEGAAFIKEGR